MPRTEPKHQKHATSKRFSDEKSTGPNTNEMFKTYAENYDPKSTFLKTIKKNLFTESYEKEAKQM